MPYPWYAILDESQNDLQQGDFIPNCPILIPPLNILSDEEERNIEIKEIDSLILSQSCDLVNDKVEIVLVCPFYSLSTFLNNLPQDQQGARAKRKIIDNLRKGYLPGYHLLNNNIDIDSFVRFSSS